MDDFAEELKKALAFFVEPETRIVVRRSIVERVDGELVVRAVTERESGGGHAYSVVQGEEWWYAQEVSEPVLDKPEEPEPEPVVAISRPQSAEPEPIRVDAIETAVQGYARARATKLNGRGR